MTLLLELLAVVMAGVVVAAWIANPAPAQVARAIVVLAVALGYIAFWGHVWQTGKSFWSQRNGWRGLSPAQALAAGVPEPGLRDDFAGGIKGRLSPGDRFYLVPTPTRDEAVYQWFTYRLLPNLSSEEPQGADWLIFYGGSPKGSGYARLATGPVEQYQPGYAIVRTRHAG